MASNTFQSYCLICTEVILPNNHFNYNKFETAFLFRILLEIPQDSYLINQAQFSLNSVPICKPCGSTVKHCKEIYSEISANVKRFWGFQNSILRNIHKKEENHAGNKCNQYWVELCRNFVKNRNVEAFKYPFVFQDPTEILGFLPEPPQLTNHHTVITDVRIESPIGTNSLEIPSIEDPLEFENEYLNDEDDISDKYESSEEDDSRREHLGKLAKKPKPSYPCNYPSCGKICKKKISLKIHQNSHQGLPSFKCEKCGIRFDYRRGLDYHQSTNICKPIQKQGPISSNIGNYSEHTNQLESFVKNLASNYDYIDQNLAPRPPPTFTNIDATSTIANNISSSDSQNINYFNSYENNFNQADAFDDKIPSTSWENSNVLSSAIEVSETFLAQNDKIILKTEPEFEDENDDQDDSNISKFSSELSEDEGCSEDDGPNDLESYACGWPGCGKRLRDKISLSCHMDQHRGTPRQKCEQCCQLFYSRCDLLKHQKKEHGKKHDKIENAKRTCNLDTSSNHFPSSSCSSSINANSDKTAKRVIINVIREADDEDSSENYESGKESLEEYKFVRNEVTGKFHCLDKSCSKMYISEYHVEKHFKPDHLKIKKKSVDCTWPGCGRSVSSTSILKGHMDKHKGTPKYKCDHCPHLCYWRSDLVKHVRAKHGINITKYERGSILKKLKFERNPITGKFNCPGKNCDKIYSHINNVKIHWKKDHLKDEEKINKPKNSISGNFTTQGTDLSGNTENGESSTVEYDFRLDQLTGRYNCLAKLCSKSSISKQYITQHYEVEHLKIVKITYPCYWQGCGKIIRDKQTWQAHMDKHNGTPRFECEQCGDKFYWRKGMIGHMKIMHGEKKMKKR